MLLVAAVYGRTLGHGFAFDDQMLVVENPMVRESPWRALDALSRGGGGHSYRPVRLVSYQVDHWIAGGLEPSVFHASNLLWHAAAALALLGLARATLGSETGAVVAAALFAAHPLATEAAAYVSGRRDLVAAVFLLVALRAWWWFLDGRVRASGVARRAAALALTLVAAALAVGAKETALVLPVVAALLAVVHARRHAAARRAGVAGDAAIAALLLALLAAVALVLYPDRLAPLASRVVEPPLAPQPALTLAVLGRYLLLALWPVRLSADYRLGAFTLPATPFEPASVLWALPLALVAAVGVVLVARGRIAGVGLLWFLVSLTPVAQLVPYGEVIAEHNAYLGLPGLALAAGEAVAVASRRWPRGAPAIAAAIVLLLAGRSFVRAGDWRDDRTLWAATLQAAPGSLRARYNLGVALVGSGRVAEGRDELRIAATIAPGDREVLLALAGAEVRMAEPEAALALAERALALGRDGEALTALGWAQLAGGRAEEAERSFAEAVALGGPPEASRGRELARRQRGRP